MQILSPSRLSKYVKEMLPRLKPCNNYDLPNMVPGYTWVLRGKHKIGYGSQLVSEAEHLVDYANRQAHLSGDDEDKSGIIEMYFPGNLHGERKAYRNHLRNKITMVIYDPVARILEMAKQQEISKKNEIIR